MAIRNKIFDLKLIRPIAFDVPVIGIGNLRIGGSGKTPHTAFLIEQLMADYKVAVLSRGYGRHTKGFHEVLSGSTSEQVGDEPLMLKINYPDIPVCVCENRPMGVAEMLMIHPETEVVLLDDVFQHRYIEPGYLILLSDYNKPFFRDHVLPAGNLREFRSGYRRADLVVYSKSPADPARAETVLYRTKTGNGSMKTTFTSLTYRNLRHVNGPEIEPDNAVLVTGIANSKPLVDHLDERCAIIKHLHYPDHHTYTTSDVREMVRWLGKVSPSVMITTAKDWVKLGPLFSELTEMTVYVQDIQVEPYNEMLVQEVRSFIKGFQTEDE